MPAEMLFLRKMQRPKKIEKQTSKDFWACYEEKPKKRNLHR